MTSKEELKAALHKKIDSIEDEHTLHVLNEDIVPYAIENRTKEIDEEDDLTDEQWAKIEHAMQQVKEGKTITLDELYSKMRSWRT
jgi:hypothetical protein